MLARRFGLFKAAIAIYFLLFVSSLVIIAYFCPDSLCVLSNWSLRESKNSFRANFFHTSKLQYGENYHQYPPSSNSNISRLISPNLPNAMSFSQIIHDPNFIFNITGNHVMVFLHIQKTGGTSFGRHLVRDLDLQKPCECKKGRKRCKCTRPIPDSGIWLFSRYTTGWRCGLHADWTELTSCVDAAINEDEKKVIDRRYFYVTILREPVSRFLSEFRHIKRGATWKNSNHLCNGRPASEEELPLCYKGEDWRNVSLDEFTSCPYNLAINRQTRMLANLSIVGCYNRTAMSAAERDIMLLASAKENLRKMAFFGICEMQKISQYIFESTFKLQFLHPFFQLTETRSTLALDELDDVVLSKIKRLNHLDIKLYDYAYDLLHDRFKKISANDKNYKRRFHEIGSSNIEDMDEMSPEYRLIRKMAKLKKVQQIEHKQVY